MLKTLDDLICGNPITVKEDLKVKDVAHLLFRYRINGILVVKKSDPNELVGVFTTTDLLRLIDNALFTGTKRINELKRVGELPIKMVATKEVVSLQRTVKIVKAIALMHKKNIHTIPVYDKKKLIGMIGSLDLINATFSD
jgi:CBS domain-containing protein